MLRALAPQLFVAMIVAAASAVAYSRGAPVWVVYIAVIVGLLIVLPGFERWERDNHPQ